MSGFNRSKFMKDYHAVVRQRKEFYKSVNPDQDVKYSDFMRSENPVDSNLVALQVTFGLDYSSKKNQFSIAQETFTIYAYNSPNLQDNIYQRVQESIVQSRSVGGNQFNDGVKGALISGALSRQLDIKFQELDIRGMELKENFEKKKSIYEDLETGEGFATESLPKTITIKGKSSKTKNQIDLINYLR